MVVREQMKRKFLMTFMALTLAANMMACGSADSKSEEVENQTAVEAESTVAMAETDVAMPELDELMAELDVAMAETVTAEEATEAVDSKFDVEITNPVIVDEEGVKVTCLGLNEETSALRVKVENNNPDNKKVLFCVKSLRLNGMGYNTRTGAGKSLIDGDDSGMAGTNAIYEIQIDKEEYEKCYDNLGVDESERMLYTIDMDYTLQIGSSSEEELKNVVLKTDNYVENFIDTYLTGFQLCTAIEDERIAEAVDSLTYVMKEGLDVYYKMVEDGFVIVLKNTSDNLLVCTDGILIQIGGGDNFDSNYNLGYYDLTEEGYISGNGGIIATKFDKTADDIRKEFEIANDVPVYAYTKVVQVDYELGEMDFYGYQASLN